MKKGLITVFKFIAVAVWGCVGYMIGIGLATWYKDSLKDTGGVIMAKDLLGIQAIPWAAGIIAAIIAFRLLFTED